jgi:ABC-type sugar transport system ATPase subunit
MIGRELAARFPPRKAGTGAERLRVEHFSLRSPSRSKREDQWTVKDVSFGVRSGEVVGIAGLQGSGNSALLSGIFGAWPNLAAGDVFLDGQRFLVRSPHDSIRRGLAHLTGDRKESGLISGLNVAQNISIASLRAISPWGVLRTRREAAIAAGQVRSLSIRLSSLAQQVEKLSGGNQQKVLLARWLQTGPKVLLLDEPTRGIDVGARHEIYALLRRWSEQGLGIVLITSEMQELLGLADRILVMHRGRISAEFPRGQATQEGILRAAMGDAWTN